METTRTRSLSNRHFPAFGLNTDLYAVNLRIRLQCGEMRTTKPSNTDTFCATAK